MATRYKSVETAELVPLESFQSDPGAQSNITDPDSRIMKKSNHAEYTQSYNAQAVVDAEGSMMVLGCYVTNHPTDRGELAEAVNVVSAETGSVATVLADGGYASEVPVMQLQSQGVEVLVSVPSESARHQRKFDFRPHSHTQLKPPKKHHKKWVVEMKEAMETDRAKELYKKRKTTVEPVFGIIKDWRFGQI